MKVFGLTGGIGMGKSTAGEMLAQRGLPVVDTDLLARQAVEPGQPAFEEIRRAFGNQVVGPDGGLRREELARIVFSDAAARQTLESITHPRIRELWKKQIDVWRAEGRAIDYRVSSEPSFDTLRFFVDAVLLQQWSGEANWANFTFPLTAGTHTLEWRYSKDPSVSSGLDSVFIDDVNLPLIVGTNSASAASLQLQHQSDGGFYLNLTGQSNQQYIVQTSTNLANWKNLSTNVAVGGFLRIPVATDATNQAQYFRAVASP